MRFSDEKLLEMHGDIKSILQKLEYVSKRQETHETWQNDHAGQWDGTTHDKIERRLSSHARKINIAHGIGIAMTAVGLGNLAAWFGIRPGG